MSRVKPSASQIERSASLVGHAASLGLRLVLTSLVMIVVYTASSMAVSQTDVAFTPEEASQAGRGILLVATVNALILSCLILRSKWRGFRLVAAVFLVHVGVETLMTQIETLYFNRALQLSAVEFRGLVVAGLVRALLFAPLAVLILGRLRKRAAPGVGRSALFPPGWGQRAAVVMALYVVVYFVFGYGVAWQWEATRLYYTGSTAIKPFFTHFRDLFLREDPWLLPFQLLRGALWTALAAVIVRMVPGRRGEAALFVALIFAALIALPIGLFPNPYMPDPVRRAHFYELTSSMLLYGVLAGWVLSADSRRGVAAATGSSPQPQRGQAA